MKWIIVAVPHSHSWLWTQTCLSSLLACPPHASGYEVLTVVVDNSPWSPAIRGITDTRLGDNENLIVVPNHKSNKFHASALDCVVEDYDFDLLMTMETDVLALRPNWLQWFLALLSDTDYAVGMWHHEQFINPSCTLYRGSVLREMMKWCKDHPNADELRWGQLFTNTAPLDSNISMAENPAAVLHNMKGWIGGPFAEKRGWPEGTFLKEAPSGQLKGPGWYEPGQQLHHWAVNEGHTYTVCPTSTYSRQPGLPVQTLYGGDLAIREIPPEVYTTPEGPTAQTVHLWGGTRALDIIKHPVTCNFVKSNTPYWLSREARFWREVVSADVQEQTLDLIRRYGFHYTGQGSDHISDRDREAAAFVRECYANGGVTW